MADRENKLERRKMRHRRVRKNLSGTKERPRLVVFKSLKHVYAQVVDDESQVCLTGASTLSPEIRESVAGKPKTEKAREVGKLIAERIKKCEIGSVVFDRNGYLYHGVVKELAEIVRSEKLLS